MRVLLAAVNAPKGEVAGNLERHLAVLEQARADGCEIAVFPELSLGSTRGRTTSRRRTASCGRSSTATASGSARGSAGEATRSGGDVGG